MIEYPGLALSLKLAASRDLLVSKYSASVMESWGSTSSIPNVQQPEWVPKNPEVMLPTSVDNYMTDTQWEESNFPFFPIPSSVSTQVNCTVWTDRTNEMMASEHHTEGQVLVMKAVLDNLTVGCNSKVGPPGDRPTVTPNTFADPAIDIPRIADAITSEVKGQRMGGPFKLGYIKNAKVNGFLSVVKPNGARRQVGNLSAPAGASFNDGISKDTLKEWRVVQTTSRQIANMIARAGKGAVLSCSDMQNAYKNLPVCTEQRRLQTFRFLNREFVDLRLIFGDRAACMMLIDYIIAFWSTLF